MKQSNSTNSLLLDKLNKWEVMYNIFQFVLQNLKERRVWVIPGGGHLYLLGNICHLLISLLSAIVSKQLAIIYIYIYIYNKHKVLKVIIKTEIMIQI